MHETVLVTGASSGIGREFARLFAAAGSNLILVARREERLRALADELKQSSRTGCTIIPADLSRAGAGAEIAQRLGEVNVDILVNNAGFGAMGRFEKLDHERQMEMIRVNVAAPTELARRFLPGMIARGHGGILNVASTAAFQPGPGMAVYFATKAYLLSLSEALHEEARGSGVTITCLAPGVTVTEFLDAAGIDGRSVYRFGAMSAARVARVAYRGFRRGRALVVPGMHNRLGVVLTRFIPRRLLRRLLGSVILKMGEECGKH